MWHYQVLRIESTEPETGYKVFQIVEVYPDLAGGPSWTSTPAVPLGSTREDLITDLKHMLRDARKYKVMVKGRELKTLHVLEGKHALPARKARKKGQASPRRG